MHPASTARVLGIGRAHWGGAGLGGQPARQVGTALAVMMTVTEVS